MKYDELEKVWQELDDLYAKRLELVVTKDSSDAELEVIYFEIARLEEEKQRIFDELLAAAAARKSIAEKDWSHVPCYSRTLNSWGYHYPYDQLYFYVTTMIGLNMVSKALWRSWHMKKADEILQIGIDSVEPGKFDFHMYSSGYVNQTDLVRAIRFRRWTTAHAFVKAGLLIAGYAFYVDIKNEYLSKWYR